MRRLNHLQKILVILIVIVLGFGCMMLGLRQQGLSNYGYSAWTYIQYGLIEYPLTSFTNIFNDVSNLWHQYDDNQYLNEELAEQKSYKTMYENERNENEELQKLLDMQNSMEDATQISARVVKRSSSTWDQEVTISAGSKQNVEKNMLVVTSEGAVGLVKSVQTNTSRVELLTHENMENNIAIKVSQEDGTSLEGVITSYDSNKRCYTMSLFDSSAILTSGTSVATSGKGGNYPSGIYVGTVTDVEQNDNSVVSTVYVKPVTNIQSFNYVIVLGKGEVSQ